MAIEKHENLLISYRKVDNKKENLAITLNNLGNLYKNTQRHKEAEAYYKEALDIYIECAQNSPVAFQSDVEMVKKNIAILQQEKNKTNNFWRKAR